MAPSSNHLKPGKLPSDLLASLLAAHAGTDDPSVIVAPAPGFDAAVVRPGEDIIVKSDPITFATSSPAAYLVAVNANDIACLGGIPRWLTATALFPEGSSAADVAKVFEELAQACVRTGIALIGGHTEITPGIDRLILSGTMIGTPGDRGILVPGGARPGDSIYLTQAAGIEGTSILATEVPEEHLRGIPAVMLETARDLLNDPGISIVDAAAVARQVSGVTAMHDPTEGGVATALHELADASSHGFEVDLDLIPIWPVTRAIAEHFDISPLGLISSGALLLTAVADADAGVEAAFHEAGIPATRIGTIVDDPAVRIGRATHRQSELPRYDADELTRVFARLEAEGKGPLQ
ncbi:MAG TPA: AIR synthase-related protein [Thermomicrobiales bacterium]|nr:AIR synthase-related protein [Thermomicrobiales bacterium]